MIGEKGNTLERILSSATSLFLEKGYEGVGLREIASRADVTTGAIYRHFDGKKGLFSHLVGDVYNELIHIYTETLSSFFLLPPEEQVVSMHDRTVETVDRMIEYMYKHGMEMELILNCSTGTEYSDLPKVLAHMDEKATDDFTTGSRDAGININLVHKELESLLTESMFSTFFSLMKKNLPMEEMLKAAHTLLDFYEAGWGKIMGL